jgi:DNA polymerase I-like protein with 3'-5' exonuclease and polymerase domains
MAKRVNPQQDLFEPRLDDKAWRPCETLPDLSQYKEVWIDCESTGNRKKKDTYCGIAWATADKSGYLPTTHEEGGNLDADAVREWARRELRGKRIGNINTGFDAEIMRNSSVDLESMGCNLHDISHAQALINENQFKGMSLDDLCREYDFPTKIINFVRPENIHKAHSSLVGPYAILDVENSRNIDLKQRPLIQKDDLGRVMKLEDELIWANNHMERNGSRLDIPKLEQWQQELNNELSELAIDIWAKTGVKLNPNRPEKWGLLMDALGLDRHTTGEVRYKKPKKGHAHPDYLQNFKGMSSSDLSVEMQSYKEEYLLTVDNPIVQQGLRMRRIRSLQDKFINKYHRVAQDGILYWNLYQLRASEEDNGTVVGRYSSANVNIQQVFKPENQVRRFGPKHIIRELFIPDDGMEHFSVDGSQLQFRIFAHYSKDDMLMSEYRNNPKVDFHSLVASLFGLDRQAAKHNNFAMVLGMGREKLANRLGKSCTCGINWAQRKYELQQSGNWSSSDGSWRFGLNENHNANCPARESNDLANQYDKKFPAAKSTMRRVTQTAEERRYLMSLLGRRRRFEDGNTKYYSGFASLLQMSEADLVKMKILRLYNERNTIGIYKLRQPVHDEVNGDLPKGDLATRKRLEEVCAIQEIPCRVPIVWSAGYGANWKEAH